MGQAMLPTIMPPQSHYAWHFHQEDLQGKNFFVLKLIENGYGNSVINTEKISDLELQLQLNVFHRTAQEVVDDMARKLIAKTF